MLKVFSVYDEKAGAYLQPFFSVNSAVAIRNFSSACKDQKSLFFAHPEDYTLFFLGTWDPSTGSLVQAEHVLPLGKAVEFLNLEG